MKKVSKSKVRKPEDNRVSDAQLAAVRGGTWDEAWTDGSVIPVGTVGSGR